MTKAMKIGALVVLAFVAACAAQAQTPRAAAIEDAAWIAGRWVGEGLGGQLEEVWSPPAGGQMVGHFRLISGGSPGIYEMMLIDVADGGVRMRVKHFTAAFVGWEEKGAWHTFEPISAAPDALEFDGLSMRRLGGDQLEIRLILGGADGEHEEVLTLHRAPL